MSLPEYVSYKIHFTDIGPHYKNAVLCGVDAQGASHDIHKVGFRLSSDLAAFKNVVEYATTAEAPALARIADFLESIHDRRSSESPVKVGAIKEGELEAVIIEAGFKPGETPDAFKTVVELMKTADAPQPMHIADLITSIREHKEQGYRIEIAAPIPGAEIQGDAAPAISPPAKYHA